MEFYIPSLFIMILAAIVALVVIPQFKPMILAMFATLCLILAIYNHASLFSNEYTNASWVSTGTLVVPYIIIMFVIVLSLGYIILLVSRGKAPTLSMPSANIPPPESATNIMTRAIGTGLVNTGIANVGPIDNSATKSVFNAGLSRAV